MKKKFPCIKFAANIHNVTAFVKGKAVFLVRVALSQRKKRNSGAFGKLLNFFMNICKL